MAIDKDTFNACKAYHNAHMGDIGELEEQVNTNTNDISNLKSYTTLKTGTIPLGTLPSGVTSASLQYRQEGSICFIRVMCITTTTGTFTIPISNLPITLTEGGAGTKCLLGLYDSSNLTEHLSECFINSQHTALTLRVTYAGGYNGTLIYLTDD